MSRSLKVSSDKINLVKQAYKRKGCNTQKELALKAGLTPPTISKFLNGKAIDHGNVVKICQILGLNWEEIASDEDKDDRKQSSSEDIKSEEVIASLSFCQQEKVDNSSQSDIFPIPDWCPDFVGRKTELDELEKKIQDYRILMLSGEPGGGKTSIASQFANKLKNDYDYKVFWFDRQEQEINLDDLLSDIKECLNVTGEYGFDTTYAEEKIELKQKISTLVKVISASKKTKYVFFIDGFQRISNSPNQPLTELKPLIERFNAFGGDSRFVFISNENLLSLASLLGSSLNLRIKEIPIKGFNKKDSVEYINKCRENFSIEWSQQDLDKIAEKTEGHPIAINMIVQWCTMGASLERILNRVVEYDQQSGYELGEKLVADVGKRLVPDEKKALQSLSILRTPVQRLAWEYLDISIEVGESLLRRKLVTKVGDNKFQIPNLIRSFWEAETSKYPEQKRKLHIKAAEYYWNRGKDSSKEKLDSNAYLESRYHFDVIEENERAGQVVNELVCRTHQQEPLLTKRLSGITSWLLGLDEVIFQNKPWLLLEKGCKLEEKGRKEEAEVIFQKAGDLFEQQEEQLGVSIALYYVGKISASKNPTSALRILNRVLEMAGTRGNISMQIRTLGKLTSCYADINQYDAALTTANQAETLSDTSGDQLGYALIQYRKGSIERHRSNFSQAEKFFSESAKAFEELGDLYRASKSWSRLGIVQERQHKYEQATKNLEKAIKIKNETDDRYGLALDLDYLADVDRARGDYEQAINRYKKSLKIKQEEKDIYGQVKTYNNLARIYLSSGYIPKVHNYLKKSHKGIQSLKYQEKHKNYLGINGARLIILGDLQLFEGKYKEALKSYKEALICLESSPHSQARALFSIGRTYLEIRHLDRAKKYLNNSLTIFKKCKTPYHETLVHIDLAKLFAITGNIKEANLHNETVKKQADNSFYLQFTYLESCGTFEKFRLLKEFDFDIIKNSNEINNNNRAQIIKYLKALKPLEFDIENKNEINNEDKKKIIKSLKNQVNNYFDRAIKIIELNKIKRVIEIARLRVAKRLWEFTVDLFFKEKKGLSNDEYSSLMTEKEYYKVIKLELLRAVNTLKIINSIPPSLAKKISQYCLYILSPIAMRLGFHGLKEQIEELAFQYIYPSAYQEITWEVESIFKNQELFINTLKVKIEKILSNNKPKIQAIVIARAKSPYSIYRKMTERKGVTFSKIIDLIGFRIITQTEPECYQVLNIVKSFGTVFEDKTILKEAIRDYIAIPKEDTNYRSIHINIKIPPTFVKKIDKNGKETKEQIEIEEHIVEFQIRTHSMDLDAEAGGAAHHHYKHLANYSSPSSKRNDKVQQYRKVFLRIECELNCATNIGKIIHYSQFEILSVDIGKNFENNDDIKTSKEKYIFKITLKAKSKKAWKTEFLEQSKDKIIQEFEKKGINSSAVFFDEEKSIIDLGNKKLSFQEKEHLLNELMKNYGNPEKNICVVTPKGQVISLKQGATPIDFAYHIHTEIGNHIKGARVNDRWTALNRPLKNGDIVEIITQNNSHPSLDWLKFVVTTTARNRIRQWYKKFHREENITRGRSLLEKELGKTGFDALLKSEQMKITAQSCNYKSVDDLLAALGYGEATVNQIANRLRDVKKEQPKIKEIADINVEKEESFSTPNPPQYSQSKSPITGIEGLLYHLAGCCQPLPGESIIGVVTLGSRGISIHRQGCKNVKHIPEERLVPVSWNKIDEESKTINYPVDIQIEVINRIGVLKDILTRLSDQNINIININIRNGCITSDNKPALISLTIDIHDNHQLESTINKIKNMGDILNVRRVSQ